MSRAVRLDLIGSFNPVATGGPVSEVGYEQGSVREILVEIVLSSRHHQTFQDNLGTLEMSSMIYGCTY